MEQKNPPRSATTCFYFTMGERTYTKSCGTPSTAWVAGYTWNGIKTLAMRTSDWNDYLGL